MPKKDIFVIGASTGGGEALKNLVQGLPPKIEASIFVVLHIAATWPNLLDKILAKSSPLPISYAWDHQTFNHGHIYVAPADHHLLIEQPSRVRLSRGPKENRSRPAVDALFRSAAYAFGPRVIGVVLSGHLDDGTAGLWAIKERGGLAIVQNPEEALPPSMPTSAMSNVPIDHCVSIKEMAPLLTQLTALSTVDEAGEPSREMKTEVQITRECRALDSGILQWGRPSLFTCPECHGTLMERKDGHILRFRCHTGHAYSLESLLADLRERTEEILWDSVRAMEEAMFLYRRIAAELSESKQAELAPRLFKLAEAEQRRASLVRQAIMSGGSQGAPA